MFSEQLVGHMVSQGKGCGVDFHSGAFLWGVLPCSMFIFRYSGFLPKSKDRHITLNGESELCIGFKVSGWLLYAINRSTYPWCCPAFRPRQPRLARAPPATPIPQKYHTAGSRSIFLILERQTNQTTIIMWNKQQPQSNEISTVTYVSQRPAVFDKGGANG